MNHQDLMALLDECSDLIEQRKGILLGLQASVEAVKRFLDGWSRASPG